MPRIVAGSNEPDPSLFPLPYQGPAELVQQGGQGPVTNLASTVKGIQQLGSNAVSDVGGLSPYLVIYLLFALHKRFVIRRRPIE